MAAESPAADADSPEQLGLVPHTDLAQLNPHPEHRSQILDQLTEVDPAVRREVEEYLAAVKGVFHIHQLHLQLMFPDLLLTDLKCFLLFDLVFPDQIEIRRLRDTDHGLQRLNDGFLLHFIIREHDHTHFNAAGGFYDYTHAAGQNIFTRIKSIDLSGITESYSYHVYHLAILLKAVVKFKFTGVRE